MNKCKFLEKLQNNQQNVRYDDFVVLVEAFGFEYDRSKGSHTMYKHTDIPEIVNIQDNQGQAKPYQVRQFLGLIKSHNLKLEDVNDV